MVTISLSLFSSVAFDQSLYATNLADSLKDSDYDGVIDARDACSNSPKGIGVDHHGCPLTKLEYFSFNFDVQFDTSSYKLKPEFQSNLKNLADFLQQVPNALILIEGHTDDEGTESYNLTLSKKRAESIANALTSIFNIEPNRVKAFGYGQEQPIASNDTEAGKMINRRVNGEIVSRFKYNNESAIQPFISNSELTIPFKRNQYHIKTLNYPAIQSLGNALQANPETLIIIEGHTDNSGSEGYNLTLSAKRAAQVAEMINAQFSIPKDRLKILGYGQTFPVAENTTLEGREKNRRVSTTIVQKFKASKEVPLPRWTIWSVDKMDEVQKNKQ
jgi:OOP family OmpA-OmpF porin